MTRLLATSSAEDFFTSYKEVFDSFDAMGLQENLLKGIYVYGFEKPSMIQQRGIVPFCQCLDVIQQAQSGTGKTATFCSVLEPTRELAQHIEKVMWALGDYLGMKVHACVGGTSVREDQHILQAGVHVVVGTPGHVDEMNSRGFKDQVCYMSLLLIPLVGCRFTYILTTIWFACTICLYFFVKYISS
ncbi:hypothetical protein UlMin_037982 [Ulmus minor]